MSEGELQSATIKILTHYPRLFFWRNNTGAVKRYGRMMTYGYKGSPDIVGLIAPDGRMFGIEFKAPDGKINDDQKRFRSDFESRGGQYILCRDLDDLKDFLEAVK